MTTLIINAPKWTVATENKKTFENTFATGLGEGYALSRAWAARCYAGCKVVLLSKDERKRAEGTLIKLVPVAKARNGLQRYDVYIQAFLRVEYTPELLNRNGVALKGNSGN